jgi:pyruvate,water dikinase
MEPLFKLLLEMADHPPAKKQKSTSAKVKALKGKFIAAVEEEQRSQANELLDLARTSYQLRDDDNIYLGKIEAQLLAAVQEAKQRVNSYAAQSDKQQNTDLLLKTVEGVSFSSKPGEYHEPDTHQDVVLKPRQLIGQPAGPGISKGRARVIQHHADLSNFKSGEILICDAVDPNMTFVVPLAAGVVERRGGMLIHGAIIAREYGLPCVTGIPDATTLIKNGDEVTVDGFLGIVTVGTVDL